jgi:sn-glycerol 3-phosphate transport system substrate-binding protein
MMEFVITMWGKYPQLKVHDTKASAATQGALISVFPESRQKNVSGMENFIREWTLKKH